MRVKTGWVFGLPGTLDEQYESVAFMRELRPHEISIHQFIPFPGTEYYEPAGGYGVRIRDPKDFASFCYGGLSDNISFDYLSQGQLIELLEYTRGRPGIRGIRQQRPGRRGRRVRVLHPVELALHERVPRRPSEMSR